MSKEPIFIGEGTVNWKGRVTKDVQGCIKELTDENERLTQQYGKLLKSHDIKEFKISAFEEKLKRVEAVHQEILNAIEQHKARGLGGMQAPGSVLSHAPMSALRTMERDLRFALEEDEDKPKTQMEQVTDATADAVATALKKETEK